MLNLFAVQNKVLLAICFGLFFLLYGLTGSAQEFYVQYGKNEPVKVTNGDANNVHPMYWRIDLYTRGGERKKWGAITGSTIEAVMKDLKKSQQWETNGKPPYTGPNTYFNYVGPIAVMKAEKKTTSLSEEKTKSIPERLSELKEKADEIDEIKSDFEQYKDIMNNDVADKTPFDGVGNLIEEYKENLLSATEQLTKLRSMLNDVQKASGTDIDKAFKDLNAAIAAAKRSRSLLKSSLQKNNSTKSTGSNIAKEYYQKALSYEKAGKSTEAVRWYKQAAAKGNNDAEYRLGEMYYTGKGVAVDKSLGIVYYKRAARNGSTEARNKLKQLGFTY